ncbi:MAG: dihydroxy-acid dehydratase, partial [Desulfuromusa sp.]|nr:dihydroxy-acid dehydratase [Desulfuromusa sp.]
GGLVALFGSLAPRGAIFKRSAADKNLFEKEGRAVVFSSLQDLADRIDDPDLDVTPEDFLVLQNAGPRSESGMPEAGYIPIPAKLARAGVKDMIRMSDARMSGTAYGTVILHITPEASIGGPLGLVRNGDRIRLSVENRLLDLLVDEKELIRRRAEVESKGNPELKVATRGYSKLYSDFVLQADEGCDFDFLRNK